MKSAIAFAGALVFLVAVPAGAHITLIDPPARTQQNDLQVLPCGDVAPTDSPKELTEGETITVQWEVGAHHGGTVRIAFSPADDLGFDENVLAADIPDNDGDPTSFEVTVPSMPCDVCTLQVYQRSANDDDNYVSCADIRILAVESGESETGEQPPGDDTTGGAEPDGDDETTSSGPGPSSDDGPGEPETTTDEPTSSDTGATPRGDEDSGGCGCRSSTPGMPPSAFLLVLALATVRRRSGSVAQRG
jgi:MYXO-CTERM domain-containing protein